MVNLKREAYDVYIGRAGKGQSGYFGNPVKVGEKCTRCSKWHMDAGSTLPCYADYLEDRIVTDGAFTERVRQLKGKRLGCFCKPGPCHGDILVRAVEFLSEGT